MDQVPGLTEAVPWLNQLLVVAVASARFAFAFVLVPLFSHEVMPPTVRNSIIVALGLVALSINPAFAPEAISAAGWAIMLGKEALAGAMIGLFFGTILWGFAAAGEIIDTKVGATVGQLVDPLSGVTTSLTGILFARLGQVLFVSFGGLTLLVGTVMASYAIWPLGPGGIALDNRVLPMIEGEFGRLFALAFIFAAPVVTILYVIDIAMGFLNRFAQQFNVFLLAMPIKAAASIFVIILSLPLVAGVIREDLMSRPDVAGGILQRVGRP